MGKISRFVPGLVKTVVENIRIEDDSTIIEVRPHGRERCKCPLCGKTCAPYDAAEHPRKWRASSRSPQMGRRPRGCCGSACHVS